MKNLFLMAGFFLATAICWAQGIVYPEKLVVANGGQFNDTTQNVVLQSFHLHNQNYAYADTINTQSIQDLLVKGQYAYLAAQDSVYKIDLETMQILHRANFPAPSTYRLFLTDSLLWVGNWYSATSDNLHAYSSDDLSHAFSVSQITKQVRDMALLNDTLLVTQNYTSSTWSDSAGYVAMVDASDGSFLGNFTLNTTDDAGWIFVEDEEVAFVNPASDTYGYFDSTGTYITKPFGKDLEGGYGPKIQLLGNSLLGIFDDELGVFDFDTESFAITGLIDSIDYFVFDTVESRLYTTTTDFANFIYGTVYDTLGQKLYNFDVGFAPEAMAFRYKENLAPEAAVSNDTTLENTSKELVLQVSDPNSDALNLSVLAQPVNGTASVNNNQNIEYTPNSGFAGIDSLTFEACDAGVPAYAQFCDQAKAYIWVDPTVGINTVNIDQAFQMYPNPAVDQIVISVKETASYDVKIIGMDGRIQKEQSNAFIQDNFTLSLSGLATGHYFVVLQNDENVQVQKLIKQ